MRRTLRPPFVVTIAVASASLACSSTKETSAVSDSAVPAQDGSDTGVVVDTARDTAIADDGPWVQPKSCPVEDPGFGAFNKPCTASPDDRCKYPDLCPAHPVGSDENIYACQDNGSGDRVWTLVSTAYTAPCPKTVPEEGSPCPCAIHLSPEPCGFGDCETARILGLCGTLDGIEKEWTIVPIGCNPPEPDASFDGDAGPDASDDGDADTGSG